MNSILEMFSVLSGVKVIFKLGYVPEDEEFYELTAEQYKAFYDRRGENDNTPHDAKIYMILPKDIRKYQELASKDVFVLTESEIQILRQAEELIEIYCEKSEKTFNSFEEKLRHVASLMPPVVSRGTKYERKND